MIKVRLELKLNKQFKELIIEYNTFEKAKYDQYLIACLILETANNDNQEEVIINYLDDIAGKGSLNSHFKKMYGEISFLSEKELLNIKENCLYPIHKIDVHNYVYYPDLDVSVIGNRVLNGDIDNGTYVDKQNLFGIKEKLTNTSIKIKRESQEINNYNVLINGSEIKIEIYNKVKNITEEMFRNILNNKIENPYDVGYGGKIINNCDGDGWNLWHNSIFKETLQMPYYYDDQHRFCQIRKDGVKKLKIAKLFDLFVYNEKLIRYNEDQGICREVADWAIANNNYNLIKDSTNQIIRMIDDEKAKKIINNNLLLRQDKNLMIYGLNLLRRGHYLDWNKNVLEIILNNCAQNDDYKYIYKANSTIKFSISQLQYIGENNLTEQDYKRLQKYKDDRETKINEIKYIVGDIASSGLREEAKKLESDKTTKRFSELIKRLIAHVKLDLDKANDNELNQWHEQAKELLELKKIIVQKIKKNEN